jgi:hypothetical protein
MSHNVTCGVSSDLCVQRSPMHDFQEYLRSGWGQAMMLTFAGAAAVQGLIAIWAATSRANWFIRALAIWGGVMLLVPIRLYEPAAVFAVANPLTVALIGGVMWLENRHRPQELATQPGMRFGLRDLFFLLLLVALVIVGIQSIKQPYTAHEWLSFGLWGTLVATIVSLAYACVVSRWRLLFAPLLALAVVGTARVSLGLGGPFFAERFFDCLGIGRTSVWTWMQKLFVLQIVYVELALLIIVVSVLVASSQASISHGPGRRLAGWALAALSVCGGLSLAWLYGQMFWLTPIPPAFAGGTTHYDEIAAITRHADPRSFWGSPIPPVAGIVPRSLPISGNQQSLIADLSVLVCDDNFVPFHVHDKVFRKGDVDDFRRALDHFYSFAQVIDDEAIRASKRGDYERAAELALINVHLGSMLQRGGIYAHAEAGKYCESYGYQRLTLIRRHLSPQTTRSVLAAIGRAEVQPEDRAIVLARSRAFEERALGWTMRLRNVFDGLRRGSNSWDPNTEINTFNILLQTDLAIRLYQLDHGDLPQSLDALVPGYLDAVPLDPLAEPAQPLRYRVENGQFVLYSVNSFGQDNGGVFGDRVHAMHHSTHDIDLETWLRP